MLFLALSSLVGWGGGMQEGAGTSSPSFAMSSPACDYQGSDGHRNINTDKCKGIHSTPCGIVELLTLIVQQRHELGQMASSWHMQVWRLMQSRHWGSSCSSQRPDLCQHACACVEPPAAASAERQLIPPAFVSLELCSIELTSICRTLELKNI